MKKRIIIVSVIAILLFLIGRPLYNRVGNALDERQQYAKSLGFHFSAKVDSMETFWGGSGYVYFHLTSGKPDLSFEKLEQHANEELKFNGSLRFIMETDSAFAFHARDMDKYQLNDSLVINSDEGRIYIFRQGKLNDESEIWKALNGI